MDLRKCFVGGLSRDTTIDSLREHFSRFGLVKEVIIPKSPEDQHARGFAFITYSDVQEANSARSASPNSHIVDGKQVDVKPCQDRRDGEFNLRNPMHNSPGGKPSPSGDLDPKKVFIGGLPPETTEQGIREVFSEYGAVQQVIIMFDSISQRPKGFGFITFDSAEVCDHLVDMKYVEYLNKKIEVKRAIMSGARYGGARGAYNNGQSGGHRGFRNNPFPRGGGGGSGGYQGRNYDGGDDCRQDVSYRENLEYRRQHGSKGLPSHAQSQWAPAYNQYPIQPPMEYLPEIYHATAFGPFGAYDASGMPFAYPYPAYTGLENFKPVLMEPEYAGQMRPVGGFLQPSPTSPPIVSPYVIMGSPSYPPRNGASDGTSGAYNPRSTHNSPRGPYGHQQHMPGNNHGPEGGSRGLPHAGNTSGSGGPGLTGSGDSVSGAGSFKDGNPYRGS